MDAIVAPDARAMMSTVTVEIRRAPHAGWRALAATVLVMTGALGAHTWAGGHVPAWPGLVLLGGVVLGSSRLVVAGRVPRWLLLPAVVAAQMCLHTSFVTMAAGSEAHAAHAAAGVASPWSGRMLLAHASVAVLTLLVWQLCHRAAVTVLRLLTLPPSYAVGRPCRRPATSYRPLAAAATVLVGAPRRGPPVASGHA
jgi:hypothetical protein